MPAPEHSPRYRVLAAMAALPDVRPEAIERGRRLVRDADALDAKFAAAVERILSEVAGGDSR